jgi:hypothetical protein
LWGRGVGEADAHGKGALKSREIVAQAAGENNVCSTCMDCDWGSVGVQV